MNIPVSNMPVADVRVFSVVHVLIDIRFFSSAIAIARVEPAPL